MRVITGEARGRKLIAPEGLTTRPTAEVVKEAIFSIIQFDIEGTKVLDLFSGSGQLGIEALSRGADVCIFVDNDKKCHDIIKQNLINTDLYKKARVALMDSISYIKSCNEVFDIVFLDPPYNQNIINAVLPYVFERMSENGIVICETEKYEKIDDENQDLFLSKKYRYGKTIVTVYRKSNSEKTVY